MNPTRRKGTFNPIIAGVIAGALLALMVLTMGYINVKYSAPWAKSHTVTAQVVDADGIAVNSDVQVAGRVVGNVSKVTARGDHADVVLRIDDAEWPLPADTSAAIRLATLLGTKYLQLVPGNDTSNHLADDAVIPVSSTRPVVDFDQWLDTLDQSTRDALTSLIRTTGAAVQGQEGNLQLLIPGLRDLSVHGKTPTATLAEHDADLNTILASLGTVASQLNQSRDDLAGVIDNMNSVAGALAANPDAVRGFIRNVDALTQTGHQVLGSGGAAQLATGLHQLDPVAHQLDHLLTNLIPESTAFLGSGIKPATQLVTEIGDGISQSDKDGFFLRQNLLGVDCSGVLPTTGSCLAPTSLPVARRGAPPPSAALPAPPPVLQPPLIPGLEGVLGGASPPAPRPLMPPLFGGLLGDWWPSDGAGGGSPADLDLNALWGLWR